MKYRKPRPKSAIRCKLIAHFGSMCRGRFESAGSLNERDFGKKRNVHLVGQVGK